MDTQKPLDNVQLTMIRDNNDLMNVEQETTRIKVSGLKEGTNSEEFIRKLLEIEPPDPKLNLSNEILGIGKMMSSSTRIDMPSTGSVGYSSHIDNLGPGTARLDFTESSMDPFQTTSTRVTEGTEVTPDTLPFTILRESKGELVFDIQTRTRKNIDDVVQKMSAHVWLRDFISSEQVDPSLTVARVLKQPIWLNEDLEKLEAAVPNLQSLKHGMRITQRSYTFPTSEIHNLATYFSQISSVTKFSNAQNILDDPSLLISSSTHVGILHENSNRFEVLKEPSSERGSQAGIRTAKMMGKRLAVFRVDMPPVIYDISGDFKLNEFYSQSNSPRLYGKL